MSQKNTKGKWEKVDDDKKKQGMRAKYLENEQKRKQLAIDNLKRRKEVEKKRLNEIELKKQQQQQSLKVRKQNQDEAYLKYLRRNTVQQGMNLYDRSQAEKKQKKQQVVQVRSTKKWGQPLSNSRQKRDDNILGLDLDVHVTKDMQKIKKFYQQGNQKLKFLQDFQKQWQQSKDMIQSSLLDSLDLDKNSIDNSKIISKGIKKQPIFESYQKMKESFLSESFDQIPQKIQHKQEEKKQTYLHKEQPRKKEIKTEKNKFQQQLKQLLGFDSLNESSAMWHIEAFKKKQINTCNQLVKKENVLQEPQMKEILPKKVQLFNWAPQIKQVQQSGVSSNMSKKPKRRQQILQNVNQRIKDEKQLQKQYQVPKIQQRRKSLEQKKQIQRRYSQLSQQRVRKMNNSRDRSTEKSKRQSEQKLPPIKPNFKQSRYSNITAPVIKSTISKESRITAPVPSCKQGKTVERFKSNISKNTGGYFDNPQTTCSQDDNLDIQQFIKDDLLDLNQRQRNLQREIKNIHFNNKTKVKQVQDKYKIQTNYKNTQQYLNKEVQNKNSQKIQCLTQDQLEDSLMRLDDLLRKQDRKLNYLNNLPIQEDRKESEDSLRISDSLDSECNSKYQQIKNDNDHPNSELLSDIIKLAARNIGQNDTNIDLNKLREQLSRQSQQNIIQKCNTKISQNKPTLIKQQKQQPKKDSTQLSYLEIMKIKNAASTSNTKPKQQKNITKNNDSVENINVNPIIIKQQPQQIIIKQTKDQKISVNERLRRLLLQ